MSFFLKIDMPVVIKFYPHKHLEEFFQFLQKNSEISIFPRYLQAISKVSPRYLQDISKISPRYLQDISKISPFGNRLAGPFGAKRSRGHPEASGHGFIWTKSSEWIHLTLSPRADIQPESISFRFDSDRNETMVLASSFESIQSNRCIRMDWAEWIDLNSSEWLHLNEFIWMNSSEWIHLNRPWVASGPFRAKRSCETVAKRSYKGDLTVWEMSVF